jgi:hypothetical protein
VGGSSGLEENVVTNYCFQIVCCYNKSMHTVIESPEFIAWSAKVWSDDERIEFIDWISDNALALLLVYAKAKFDNLRPEFLLKLKERFDEQS